MRLGTVYEFIDGVGVRLILDGENNPTTKYYTFITTYYPIPNDRVLIEEFGDTYVVLGKVDKTYTPSYSSQYVRNKSANNMGSDIEFQTTTPQSNTFRAKRKNNSAWTSI